MSRASLSRQPGRETAMSKAPSRNEFGWFKKQRRPVWLEVNKQERVVKRDCKVVGARSCRHL